MMDLQEIYKQLKSTRKRLAFVKKHKVGYRILLVKDVERLLEIVDTQAAQMQDAKKLLVKVRREGAAKRHRDYNKLFTKLGRRDRQLADMRADASDTDKRILELQAALRERDKQLKEGREIVQIINDEWLTSCEFCDPNARTGTAAGIEHKKDCKLGEWLKEMSDG